VGPSNQTIEQMSRLSDYLDADRVPRKFKKAWLGPKLSKSRLRKMLANVVIIDAKNGRDSAEIFPHQFCPKCGCEAVRMTGNKACYPERWDSGFCMRCGFHVIESDNSPYYHCLELKEYDYVI
jgi:hypothetical protein